MVQVLGGLCKLKEGVFLHLTSGKKFLVIEEEKDKLRLEIGELNEEEYKFIKENCIPYPNQYMMEEQKEVITIVSVARMLHLHYYKTLKEARYNEYIITF